MVSAFKQIQSVTLKHFTTFEDADLDFCPGLNVLIGANSTGKTLLMKIMYALLKTCEAIRQQGTMTSSDLNTIVVSKLQRIFHLQRMSDLIRNEVPMEPRKYSQMEVCLNFAETYAQLVIEHILNDQQELASRVSPRFQLPASFTQAPPAVYFPTHEFLSIHEGFISAYQSRELPYDETYYDLSVALNALPLRSEKLAEVEPILSKLRILLGHDNGRPEPIIQENGRFYIELPEGRFESHLVAEGLST